MTCLAAKILFTLWGVMFLVALARLLNLYQAMEWVRLRWIPQVPDPLSWHNTLVSSPRYVSWMAWEVIDPTLGTPPDHPNWNKLNLY